MTQELKDQLDAILQSYIPKERWNNAFSEAILIACSEKAYQLGQQSVTPSAEPLWKTLLKASLSSQLGIEKARLKAYNECYAEYSETTQPLIKGTEATIKEIERQLKTLNQTEQ